MTAPSLLSPGPRVSAARREAPWARRVLIGVALVFLAVFLLVPLATVFATAFRDGAAGWLDAVTDPETLDALQLTLLAVAIAVPVHVVFGVAAAWAITRFRFRGKRWLVSLIDLPFAVSPVVAGMLIILLFGGQSALGAWLAEHDVRVAFAVPGVVLATLFVTFPFVARELIPVMQAQRGEPEIAALTLGASGWQTFWLITLPSIRWALLHGVVLCTARAVGEFGAVSVVSGHIRGETTTASLHIEILYNEYRMSAAFSVATLLVGLALLTLVARAVLRRRVRSPL